MLFRSLALELIETGHAPHISLADPILATRLISRDESWKWAVEREGGRTMGALDIQHAWLKAARTHCDRSEDTDWIIGEWERVLADLATDPMSTRDRCDWAAKRFLLAEDDRNLICPGVNELARRAGDFGALSEAAKARHDAVGYLASLIAAKGS